jgi:short-subunit dehydrogenase
MLKILIIGGASAIAQGTAKCFAEDGAELFLVDLSAERLEAVKNDLLVRGAKKVETFTLDVTHFDRHQPMFDSAIEALGGLDAVLVAHGILGNQKRCEEDFNETLRELNINLISTISILTLAANYFEKQKRGVIAAISSAAGDRGRMTNYVYGTAKGGLTIFMQGLRARMDKCGVAVVTIKPGRVDTPMTKDFKKNFMFADPNHVGKEIYKAMKAGKNTVYIPTFWLLIMLIIRNIPEFVYKKLSM